MLGYIQNRDCSVLYPRHTVALRWAQSLELPAQTGFYEGINLPFEDDSFDAAHCHAVLMHVLDTQAVLAEVKRILKPGGIISSREMTVAFSFLEPLLGSTEAAWDTFSVGIAQIKLIPPTM